MLRARKSPPTMDFAVPAINIVFLLLLFFITNGSQVNRPELDVAPPIAELLPGDRLPRPLLAVRPDGTLHLDGQAVSQADLLATIAARRAAEPSAFATLNILADRTMPARDLLALMDRLRGGSDMALKLVTRREDRRSPTP